MVAIFNNTDRVMLKLIVGNEARRIYAVAHSCASMTGFMFVAILGSMRSAIFEYRKNYKEAFENSLKGLYSIIRYFSLVQCVF